MIRELLNAISSAGYHPPTNIIADSSSWNRFATDPKKPHSKDGWVIADPVRKCASFGSWRDGSKIFWTLDGKPIPDGFRDDINKRIEAGKKAVREKNAKTAKRAQVIYAGLADSGEAEYLTRKNIEKPAGVRFIEGEHGEKFGFRQPGRLGAPWMIHGLAVPMMNGSGELVNLQIIADNSKTKYYMPGGQTSGCYHSQSDLRNSPSLIILAEGIATAQSIQQEFDKLNAGNRSVKIAVVTCFAANNLPKVAKYLRGRFESADFIIAADGDDAGHKGAGEAAAFCRGRVISAPQGQDFNDTPIPAADVLVGTYEAPARAIEKTQSSMAYNARRNYVMAWRGLGYKMRAALYEYLKMKYDSLTNDVLFTDLKRIAASVGLKNDQGRKQFQQIADRIARLKAEWKLLDDHKPTSFGSSPSAAPATVTGLDEVRNKVEKAISSTWENRGYIVNKDGAPKSCLPNFAAWAKENKSVIGDIWFDDFSKEIRVGDEVLEDCHVTQIQRRFENDLGCAVKDSIVPRMLVLLSHENRRDPLMEFLNGLEWDGESRIDDFARVVLGDSTPAGQEAMRLVFLQGAARGLDPGCKADYVALLVGGQGLRKSSIIATLFGRDFFSEFSGTLEDSSAHGIQGTWCLELAEIAAMRKTQLETCKAFISKREDRFRKPYDRTYIRAPRRFVFIATTNVNTPLTDPTGNRRFLPVIVGKEIHIGYVEDNRNQLWAEAVSRYRDGEQRWPIDDLVISERQESVRDAPPSEDQIAVFVEENKGRFARTTNGMTFAEVMTEALHYRSESIPQHYKAVRIALEKAGLVYSALRTGSRTVGGTRKLVKGWRFPK